MITVNCKCFDVKIFSDSMACAKIKCTKYMRNINDNAVQGRLSENYLTQKIIAIYGICVCTCSTTYTCTYMYARSADLHVAHTKTEVHV